ncbi:MAG TPA: penicillin-binding protein 2 [Stellaceae bacterium]|nr:penicillin-binding protein 2 [Stellaceae bacterium]
MPRESQRDKLLTRRAALLGGGQLALAAVLVARMYQLQVLDKARYTLLSDENRINLRLLAPPRGRILDRFGVALADNKHNFRVVVVPEQTSDLDATLVALGSLIGLDADDRRRLEREARQHHSFVPLEVRANLSWDEMAKIEVAIPELAGVAIEQGLIRNYPYGQTASHPLGYVAKASEREVDGNPLLELPDFRIGKSGVEKARDLVLRGSAGTSEIEVNAYGRVIRELARQPGQPGEDVTVALDMTMQNFTMQRCATEPSVSCVLLDAPTGDVLALASSPSYDPMLFSQGLSEAAWQELANDPRKPLTDKAIAGMYPPGSTFKPTVALAALAVGAITPETEITCPGFIRLGNAVFHCWKHGGHGTLRLHDAIKESCDVFFYETARRTGIDNIAPMAHRFGYGAPLGLDIPGERGGLIPTREWKLATLGVPWQHGETLITGIGQGFVLVTPLQLATMAARLVTGRAVVPHIVRENGRMPAGGDPAPPDFAPLGVSPENIAIVIAAMVSVVNEPRGTAYHARIKDPAFAMGGKTGTSQVHRITAAEREHGVLTGARVPWKDRDHALFVGFAPIDAPRYVAAAVVEHGGTQGGEGGAVAAPIVADVLLEVQKRDPARRLPPPDSPPPAPAATAPMAVVARSG